MKKGICVAILAFLVVLSSFAAPGKEIPPVIAIHVGSAHPLFNPAQYPDLKIYFLPEYEVNVEKIKSEKKFSVVGDGLVGDYINTAEKKLFSFSSDGKYLYNKAFLFDKNGICVFEGNLFNTDSSTKEALKIQNNIINATDKKPLKESLVDFVQKTKAGKLNQKANLLKDKNYVGGPAFDLMLTDASGSQISFGEVLKAAGPALVIFFSVPVNAEPSEVSLATQSTQSGEATQTAQSATALFGAVLKGALAAPGLTYTALLDQIELDFYGYLVNKAR